MARREFLIGTVGLLAVGRPSAAQAPSKVLRIGLLGGSTPTSPESRHVWQPFFQELQALGYVEGQNVVFEGRFYGDDLEKLPGFAAELARLQVDVIVAAAAPAPEAAKRATTTIPIVMANHSDPVTGGLVASFARPGGNVTGLSLLAVELRIKALQLLKETLPTLTRVALLRNPSIPFNFKELETALPSLRMRASVVEARAPGELAEAFSTATRQRAEALLTLGGSMFFAHREHLAELGIKHRLPTMYLLKEHVEAGGFMAYGVDLRDNFRRTARYVDRIVKGARPADLPVEQPTKFELAINLKTARSLGLKIPPAVLARADLVVE